MEYLNSEFFITTIIGASIGIALTLIVTNSSKIYNYLHDIKKLHILNQYKCFYYPWRDDMNNLTIEKRFVKFSKTFNYPFKILEYENSNMNSKEVLYTGFGSFERNTIYFVLKNNSNRENVHIYLHEPTTTRRKTIIGLCLYVGHMGKQTASPILLSDNDNLNDEDVIDFFNLINLSDIHKKLEA